VRSPATFDVLGVTEVAGFLLFGTGLFEDTLYSVRASMH
jgi:hypothetical protein